MERKFVFEVNWFYAEAYYQTFAGGNSIIKDKKFGKNKHTRMIQV
jgi:hypothetical protein